MSSHNNSDDCLLCIPVQDLPIYRRETLQCFASHGLATLKDLVSLTEFELAQTLTDYYAKMAIMDGAAAQSAAASRQVSAIKDWLNANNIDFYSQPAPQIPTY